MGYAKKVVKAILSTAKTAKRKAKKIYRQMRYKIHIPIVRLRQYREIKRIKRKGSINVAFLIVHSSVWKYDELYKLMEQSDDYKPVVIICPYTEGPTSLIEEEMEHSYNELKEKGYEVKKSKTSAGWIDLEKRVKPDVIFFGSPWDNTIKKYQINNLYNKLTCYTPYFFVVNNKNHHNYNKYFHNVLWKLFYETNVHKELAQKYSINNGANVTVTGYPGFDPLLRQKKEQESSPWGKNSKNMKKIIWAPHHTIKGQGQKLRYSNFKRISTQMLEVAKHYRNKAFFAFKPHPRLKSKLYNDPEWGKKKTRKYYNKWSELENGQLEEGGYVDLFLESDAMMHSSASFMGEYMYTGNPVLYIMSDKQVADRMNKVGKMAFEKHYTTHTVEGIKEFIERRVLCGNDYMLGDRLAFKKEFLHPPNGVSASKNILRNLSDELK